jgi:preprotein translocase subunit YajC
MALQDLTPQLRTRLSRMERAVGWFVFLAMVLLLFGFGYYVYHIAQQKGWFLVKAKFLTYVHDASGLNVGDPVVLMGFQVGQITSIAAMPPRTPHDVRIEFEINQVNQEGEPYFGYIWSEGSQVKINASDFLGKRSLEVTRGTSGFGIYNTHALKQLTLEQAENLGDPDKWRLAENVYDTNSNLVLRAYRTLAKTNVEEIAALSHQTIWAFHDSANHDYTAAVWNQQLQRYESWTKTNEPYWLPAVESPAVTEQLQALVTQVQKALPNVLSSLTTVLSNSAVATSNLNAVVVEARPSLTGALTNASSLLANTDTNLTAMLINLSDITSNLNAQVQANSNVLSGISKMVTDSDDFVQGLKHHWLLRSAFKNENKGTNAPPSKPLLSPRQSQ